MTICFYIDSARDAIYGKNVAMNQRKMHENRSCKCGKRSYIIFHVEMVDKVGADALRIIAPNNYNIHIETSFQF